ncbi:unnamed protein product [Closterium sp. NIES-65]|nr:unnamed protein product [Closterium sp. NIES-65]
MHTARSGPNSPPTSHHPFPLTSIRDSLLPHPSALFGLPSPFPPPTLPPARPLPPAVPHEPLAARVLQECAAAWNFSGWGGWPSNWRVGGDCDAADYIKCDSNGFITDLILDDTPYLDWGSDYGGRPDERLLTSSGIPPCICPLYSVPTNATMHFLCAVLQLAQKYAAQRHRGPHPGIFQHAHLSRLPPENPLLLSLALPFQILYLSNNQLSGAIPPDIGALTALQELKLYNNQLSGAIPPTIGALTSLEIMNLFNNQLSGAIPSTISTITSLKVMALENNKLGGSIPDALSTLTNLDHLVLSNNKLTGAIPTSIAALTNLTVLCFSSARHIISRLTFTTFLLPLSPNAYPAHHASHAPISSYPTHHTPTPLSSPHLPTSSLSRNSLTGSLDNLSSLIHLQGLDLSNNAISGPIPAALGDLVYLYDLTLSSNNLTGTIPDSISSIFALNTLYVPRSPSLRTLALSSLHILSLSARPFLPARLHLPACTHLSLWVHCLPLQCIATGALQYGSCRRLDSNALLSNNNFTGSIPDSIPYLPFLYYLDLSYTMLTGSIPYTITELQNLLRLDLRIPTLTGSIPASMGAMLNLQYFYVNFSATPCGSGECEAVQYSGTAFCRACTDFCDMCSRECKEGEGGF